MANGIACRLDIRAMARNHLSPLPLPPHKWDRIARSLKLAPRQKQIAELILRNWSDKQIVAETGLGHPTIRTYIKRIFDRVGVADRHELVLLILRLSHGTDTSS
jgi:DNA-binding NarL/FixJ family response regulator